MNNIIVGMGEALWDVLPEGKKIGGAPANFAYHVSQFGFDSRVVSAVGKDELGDEILNVFNEKKLKTQIEQVDYPTGTVQVTLDNEGVPCYEIKEGVAWDNIPFTDELKRAAFEAIYKDGCHDCGDWIDTLVNCYSEEVMDALGNNPNEVYAELEDIWENVDYEDPRTGICLTYQNWAEYFAGEFAHTIYDELVKAKQTNELK